LNNIEGDLLQIWCLQKLSLILKTIKNNTMNTKQSLKKSALLLLVMITTLSCTTKAVKLTDAIEIPTGGNSWVYNNTKEDRKIISKNGIQNWENTESNIRTYFKVTEIGDLHLGINAKVLNGTSKIRVTIGKESKDIKITNQDFKTINVGVFNLKTVGYHFIEIQGLEKSDTHIADIKSFLIAGKATKSKVYFAKDDFYFGRRGPSVHLSYETPKDKDVVWFYNEISIPKGEDVIGSYFMANGFKDGYFGIQVNSENERRILFSVWSPYNTQNPKDIPDDYKIILLGKGDGVTSGEFGNEGSGGQSYKVYDWKAESTYKFLLKGVPSVNNSTDYSAYFFSPEENKWSLIASFRRPHTTRYITKPYSFLENFIPSTGNVSRKGMYQNQWVYTSDNRWTELTKAKFTADATARKESRMDYEGGIENDQFYMKNCGFFSNTTSIDTFFTRKASGNQPTIDLKKLELLKR